jgi:hypothetical protein
MNVPLVGLTLSFPLSQAFQHSDNGMQVWCCLHCHIMIAYSTVFLVLNCFTSILVVQEVRNNSNVNAYSLGLTGPAPLDDMQK